MGIDYIDTEDNETDILVYSTTEHKTVYELLQRYINKFLYGTDVEVKDSIGSYKRLVKYISANIKTDTGDIDSLDNYWDAYTDLCYRYDRQPSIKSVDNPTLSSASA